MMWIFFTILVFQVGFSYSVKDFRNFQPQNWAPEKFPDSSPCIKSYGNESFVCVCNATYCDTITKIENQSPNFVYVYTSGKSEGRFTLKAVPIIPSIFDFDPKKTLIITPNPLKKRQTIAGFGGAFTDSASRNIRSLKPSAQELLLKAYFAEDGLRYTCGRVPIAGTDFSNGPYAYDDHVDDLNLTYFSLAPEDYDLKIPLIKEAQKIAGQKLKLFGAAWNAPAWVKDNNTTYSGPPGLIPPGYIIPVVPANQTFGPGHIRPQYYDFWARYHLRFLSEYQKEDLEFYAITPGNELAENLGFPGWSPTELTTWISQTLGPYLRSSFPDVKLLLPDDFSLDVPNYVQVMLNESAAKYIDGWAVHPYLSAEDIAPNLQLAHETTPEKIICQTEYSIGVQSPIPVDKGSWSRGEDYALRIIISLQNWASVWLDWNLALNLLGGPTFINNTLDSPIIINNDGEFWKQPIFYAQGHFSQFLLPGSKIIETSLTQTNSNISVVSAITPEKNVVVIVLNTGTNDVHAAIKTGPSSKAPIKIPGKSITTALYRNYF